MRAFRNSRLIAAVVAVMLFALFLLAGCSATRQQPTTGPPQTVMAAGPAQPVASPPVIVALLQDQTGSTTWTRTPQLAPEEIEPLIPLLMRGGGELALG